MTGSRRSRSRGPGAPALTPGELVGRVVLVIAVAAVALPAAGFLAFAAFLRGAGCFLTCDPDAARPLLGVLLGGLAVLLALVPAAVAGWVWRRWLAAAVVLALEGLAAVLLVGTG